MTAVAPGGECPLWLKFLDRVTDSDSDLAAFLQRICGYSLTGSTREEALFFLYGTGANGKSKFLGAISGMLGSYARTAPVETFLATHGEHHPTDLAGLQGARLVSSIETEDGRRWAESKIKALTGGDTISARFMRQDFFDFVPAFKLVIAGNHKPSIRSVDEAIRRRFHLVPFTVTIPESERDGNLAEKLREEWPGILRWAVEGCLAWQREGLRAPDAVKDATAEYMADEDAFAQWIDERCTLELKRSAQSSALYVDYCHWCEESQEKAMASRKFSPELERRGFRKEATMVGKIFHGIALKRGL
jgi:putative DNA primase/helicase